MLIVYDRSAWHPRLLASPFMKLEFEVRRKMAAEWDRNDLLRGFALFLFSARYIHEHVDHVDQWVKLAGSSPAQPQDKVIP